MLTSYWLQVLHPLLLLRLLAHLYLGQAVLLLQSGRGQGETCPTPDNKVEKGEYLALLFWKSCGWLLNNWTENSLLTLVGVGYDYDGTVKSMNKYPSASLVDSFVIFLHYRTDISNEKSRNVSKESSSRAFKFRENLESNNNQGQMYSYKGQVL